MGPFGIGPFEMIVAVVLIAVIGNIIGKYIDRRNSGAGRDDYYDKKSLKPYLERIDSLEERIRTLERIVTDKTSRLAREIDDL